MKLKINHVVSVFAQELKAQLAPPKSKTISVPIQVAKSISQSSEKVEHKSKLQIKQLFYVYDLSLVANTCLTFFILNQKPLKVACAWLKYLRIRYVQYYYLGTRKLQ